MNNVIIERIRYDYKVLPKKVVLKVNGKPTKWRHLPLFSFEEAAILFKK